MSLRDQVNDFKGNLPLQRVTLKCGHTWEFYDKGGNADENTIPLICLPPLTGSAASFYSQVNFLSSKGYRIIALNPTTAWTHKEFTSAFDRFLEHVGADEIHIFGVGLGAFLAYTYAAHYRFRVLSLVLENVFIDTTYYFERMPCLSILGYTPHLALQEYIKLEFPSAEDTAALRPHIREAVEFHKGQLSTLTQPQLASRLTLMCSKSEVPAMMKLGIDDDKITFIDTLDRVTLPREQREEAYLMFPNAMQATLKTGGDFAYNSERDEVNLHLQVHLRRHYPEIEAVSFDVEDGEAVDLMDEVPETTTSTTTTTTNTTNTNIDGEEDLFLGNSCTISSSSSSSSSSSRRSRFNTNATTTNSPSSSSMKYTGPPLDPLGGYAYTPAAAAKQTTIDQTTDKLEDHIVQTTVTDDMSASERVTDDDDAGEVAEVEETVAGGGLYEITDIDLGACAESSCGVYTNGEWENMEYDFTTEGGNVI